MAPRSTDTNRRLLVDLFDAVIGACDPGTALRRHMDLSNIANPIILAVGKAAGGMAREAVRQRPDACGCVVVRHGEAESIGALEVITAGHPIPDESSLSAASKLLDYAEDAGPEDHVIVLLSGGASALACAPPPGITLDTIHRLNAALLQSGADISEINTVRRHLSAIKGGRLVMAASPARLSTYAISDVVGDRPEDIGSGPTVGDPTTIKDAQRLLARLGIHDPGGWTESVKPDAACLHRTSYQLILSSEDAIRVASDFTLERGYQPVLLGTDIVGEARQIGREHGQIAQDYVRRGGHWALISGGELTVTFANGGRGGPNTEYAAALALEIEGLNSVVAFAADTDGLDGSSGGAGAFVDRASAGQARQVGFGLDQALIDHDTASAFATLGDLFTPGPTGLNLNDLRVILIDG